MGNCERDYYNTILTCRRKYAAVEAGVEELGWANGQDARSTWESGCAGGGRIGEAEAWVSTLQDANCTALAVGEGKLIAL